MPNNKNNAKTDAEIIEMYERRDERAIEETDKKYGKYLLRLCRNVLNGKTECEECVHDTYLAAWDRIPPERPQSLLAYLTQLARYKAIDKYRAAVAAKRRMEIPSAEELTVFCIDDDKKVMMDSVCLRDLISEFVRSLPERQRYIFVARYFTDRTPRLIAQRLRVSQATVYRELEDVKQKLKNFLIEREMFI